MWESFSNGELKAELMTTRQVCGWEVERVFHAEGSNQLRKRPEKGSHMIHLERESFDWKADRVKVVRNVAGMTKCAWHI